MPIRITTRPKPPIKTLGELYAGDLFWWEGEPQDDENLKMTVAIMDRRSIKIKNGYSLFIVINNGVAFICHDQERVVPFVGTAQIEMPADSAFKE